MNMKTQKTLIAILLTFVCSSVSVPAQGIDQIELNQEQIAQMKLRGAEKTAQMNDYISYMANKKKKKDIRLDYKDKALNLFLGKGFSYKEFGEIKEGVIMQVTSKRASGLNKVVGNPLMRDYFQSLIDRLKVYTDVKISSTEVAGIKVSKLRRVDTNEWVCTCQYDQVFEGIRDGRLIYKDITTKYVECHIFVEETELGEELVVKLGDVFAVSTK